MIRKWLTIPQALTDHPAQALAAQWACLSPARPATIRAHGARLCRDRASVDRIPRPLSGRAIDAAVLAAAQAADMRSFLADRRGRAGRGSAARGAVGGSCFLPTLRSRRAAIQLPRTRAPKRPRTLPRPAAPDEAMDLAENAAEAASAPWIGARDLAILLLLLWRQSSGRRSAVADGRRFCRSAQTCKSRARDRERGMVPIVRGNARSDRRICSPMSLSTRRVSSFCFAVLGGGALQCGPRSPVAVAAARRRLGLPEFRNSARVAPQLRDASTCAPGADLRVAPGTPRSRRTCPPRKSIRPWMLRAYSTSIVTLIRAPDLKLVGAKEGADVIGDVAARRKVGSRSARDEPVAKRKR